MQVALMRGGYGTEENPYYFFFEIIRTTPPMQCHNLRVSQDDVECLAMMYEFIHDRDYEHYYYKRWLFADKTRADVLDSKHEKQWAHTPQHIFPDKRKVFENGAFNSGRQGKSEQAKPLLAEDSI